MQKVRYIRDILQPDFLAGKEGNERELYDAHAFQLWGDDAVELVNPPAGYTARAHAKEKPANGVTDQSGVVGGDGSEV